MKIVSRSPEADSVSAPSARPGRPVAFKGVAEDVVVYDARPV